MTPQSAGQASPKASLQGTGTRHIAQPSGSRDVRAASHRFRARREPRCCARRQEGGCGEMSDSRGVHPDVSRRVRERGFAVRRTRSALQTHHHHELPGPIFGRTALKDFSTEQITAFMNHQARTPKPKGKRCFKKKTITNHVAVLSGLLRHACRSTSSGCPRSSGLGPRNRIPASTPLSKRQLSSRHRERSLLAFDDPHRSPLWPSHRRATGAGVAPRRPPRQDAQRRADLLEKIPSSPRRTVGRAPCLCRRLSSKALSRHSRRLGSPWSGLLRRATP